MAPVDLSETPPSSPTCSPPRKKAKFSLRLKGKSKQKRDEDENSDHTDNNKQTKGNLYPIFRSPIQENDGSSDRDCMEVEPVLPSFALAGLLNRGNICYANAVLQVLRRCPGFERFVSQLANDIKVLEDATENDKDIDIEPKYLINHLSKLLSKMHTYEVDFMNDKENCNHLRNKGPNLVLAAEPHDFMEAFRELYPSFECNLQHDAQEFLCSLIMALQESTNEIKKNYNDNPPPSLLNTTASSNPFKSCQDASFIKKLFQGKLVHQTKCLNCEQSKLRYEDIQEISVPVVEYQPYLDARKKLMLSPTPKKNKADVHTLQWAISQFASSECLQGDNKYFCENCNTYCEARISTCFEELPTVLSVHLKRFTSSIGLSSKITSNLQTPLTLSVQEWCSNKCQSQSNVYELFGIVLHSGVTSGSGHYETYIRIPNEKQKENEKTAVGKNDVSMINGDEVIVNNAAQNTIGDSAIGNNVASNTSTVTVNNVVPSFNGEAAIGNNTVPVIKDDAVVNNITINMNTTSNGEAKEELMVDINQNCVDKTELNALDNNTSKRVSKRILRPRKAKKSTSDIPMEESSKHSEMNEEEARKQESNTCTENDKSPLNVQERGSCMPLITKYFQRSKKLPSNKPKIEKPEHQDSEKPINNENRDNCLDNEPRKPSHQKVNRTIEDSFKRINSKKTSKPSTIRKLDFVKGSTERTESSESDSQESEDNPKTNFNVMDSYPEQLTKDWMHFDDCTVDSVAEKEIIDVLSASESSFMSPYLLFYQKSENIL